MPPTTSACPLDIAEQTLSAWHDDLLDPAARHNLEGHLPTCVACQRRLASLQYVSHVLRGQREPQLTAQVWRGLQARIANPAARRSALARGRIPAAALTTAAAVVLITLFAGVLALRDKYPSGSGSSMISPTATSAATSTAPATASPTTTSTASASIPAGWTKANIPDGLMPDVVFAPSAPSIAYAVNTLSGGRVVISGSRNGGATWQTLSYPTSQANRCEIAVDPTDVTDVALVCTPAASSGFAVLRSFDGAKTWTRQALGITVNCYQNMGFADSTLLMAFSLCESMSSQTQLIASVNRGPFKRLDSNGKVSGITLGAEIRLMTGHGSTYLIQMGVIEYSPPTPQLADTLIVSHDAGATWKTTTLSDNGASVHLLATDPLDHNWVGAYKNAPTQLALSRDGGQTWRKLPAPWANELGPDFLFVAPDGTVLVTDARVTYVNYTGSTSTLYEASPGAAQWRSALLIPGPGSVFGRAARWDSSGRPTTLWAVYASDGGQGAWYLISHPLPA